MVDLFTSILYLLALPSNMLVIYSSMAYGCQKLERSQKTLLSGDIAGNLDDLLRGTHINNSKLDLFSKILKKLKYIHRTTV